MTVECWVVLNLSWVLVQAWITLLRVMYPTTPESKPNKNLHYYLQQHFKITHQTVWILLDSSFCAFLSSTYKASTKTFALLIHEKKKKPMKDEEVLNFYGKRDHVGILLGCPDLGGSNRFCCSFYMHWFPRPPSSAYLFLTTASYL